MLSLHDKIAQLCNEISRKRRDSPLNYASLFVQSALKGSKFELKHLNYIR